MKKTGFISTRSNTLLLTAWVLLASGCLKVRVNTGAPDVSTATQSQLTAAMNESAAAWNRGDLDAFLAVYKDDALTAFMAPQITYGIPDIKARYARSYFKDGKPKAQLTYDDLKFRALGENHILMTGRWHLTDPAGQRENGFYTLVWEKTDAGWRIVHDHST